MRLILFFPFIKYTSVLVALILISILMGCNSEKSSSSNVKIIELKDFKTFIAIEENKIGNPSLVKYHNESHLFIYDKAKGQIIELNRDGDILNEYGGRGRGPGEFISVNNIFLINEHLYVVDDAQYRISKFNLKDSTVSTFGYGKQGGGAPPPPFSTSVVRANNINNQPAVTLSGNILLPKSLTTEEPDYLYDLVNWKGNTISEIGDIPVESAFVINPDEYQLSIKNRDIPAFYKSNAFSINDYSKVGEYYFVYSAFPKIAKYNSSGKKIWESDTLRNAELDSIAFNFYNTSDRLNSTSRIGLRYYIAGVSSENGNLYLALNSYSNDLWIHELNVQGKLIRRYKLIANDQKVLPIFDINFNKKQIFTVTSRGDIRTYSF